VVELGNEKLVQILTAMLKARKFDQKTMELFTGGSIPGFIHVGIGQEAIAAGVCLNLRPTDAIFTTHRGHAQSVAKGLDLKRAMAELFGKEVGFCRGKAGSMYLADKNIGVLGASGIVGAGIPVATGVAFSYQAQGTDRVTVCFFGDGASNQGTFHESLNMASIWKLPIVYCCENNSWAQFTPQKRITKVTDIANRAAAYDMPGVTVDGDDVLAVYETAGEVIGHARRGDGPTLLECKTHRWFGHYVGDPQGYRDAKEIERCREFDPIERLQNKLIQEKVLTSEEIEEKVSAEVDEAVKFAEESPFPEPAEALDDIYYEAGVGQ
jgi:pyruvate dehydrogenase E1 component alpha subunit